MLYTYTLNYSQKYSVWTKKKKYRRILFLANRAINYMQYIQ